MIAFQCAKNKHPSLIATYAAVIYPGIVSFKPPIFCIKFLIDTISRIPYVIQFDVFMAIVCCGFSAGEKFQFRSPNN